MENVVLVDENDTKIGIQEKQKAHIEGNLHRAFSVFVFNDEKELLLQKRADIKYHSPLKWTNTCCSHPRENETYIDAVHRRLKEELGFDCPVEEKFHFIYKANVGQGLVEHEFDRVFIGRYNGEININKQEVDSIRWILLEDLKKEIKNNPEEFTEWFKIIFKEYSSHIKS